MFGLLVKMLIQHVNDRGTGKTSLAVVGFIFNEKLSFAKVCFMEKCKFFGERKFLSPSLEVVASFNCTF